MSRSPTYSDCESPPPPGQKEEQSAHPPQSDGGGRADHPPRGPDAIRARRSGTAADPCRTHPTRSRPGSPPPVSDRPEPRSPDSCGRGRGRAPPRQAQPPSWGRGSGKDAHLPPARDAGDPAPRCPHAWRWPRPSPTARPESFLALRDPASPAQGPRRAPPQSPACYLAAPRRGGGAAWAPRVGAASPAPRPSHSRGRKQGAGGGGSRSPSGAGAPGSRAWAPHPPPPSRGPERGDEQPGRPEASGRGATVGAYPGPAEPSRRPGPPEDTPYRTAARRRALGSGGRLRAAPHLCPEWVAAHGPGSAVSGRRRRWWRRG